MAQVALTPNDVFTRSLRTVADGDRIVIYQSMGMAPSGITFQDFMALFGSMVSGVDVTFSTDDGITYNKTPVGTVTDMRFDDGTNPPVVVAVDQPANVSHVSVGPTAPPSPNDGHLWSNTAANRVEQYDTATDTWIIIGPGGVAPTPTVSGIQVAVGGDNVAVGGLGSLSVATIMPATSIVYTPTLHRFTIGIDLTPEHGDRISFVCPNNISTLVNHLQIVYDIAGTQSSPIPMTDAEGNAVNAGDLDAGQLYQVVLTTIGTVSQWRVLEGLDQGRTPVPPQTHTRYMAISDDDTFVEAEFLAGNTSTSSSLTVPTWMTGRRYIGIAVPDNTGDVSTISTGGINVSMAFMRVLGTLDISGETYKVWRTLNDQASNAGGQIYVVNQL